MSAYDAPGSGDDFLRVNVAAVSSAADTLARTQRNIDASLAALRAYCDGATARWDGPAKAAYAVLQARWDTNAADLNATLGQIATGVQDGSSTYSAAEARNVSRWGFSAG